MKSNLTLLFGLLLFSTLHAQVPAYVPTDGLVGWWPFNGNANDESGNGRNLSVVGPTITTDRYGNNNSAYQFNGLPSNAEYLVTSDISSISEEEFTYSAWFKSDQFNANQSPATSFDFDNFNIQCIASINPNTWSVGNAFDSGLSYDNSKLYCQTWTSQDSWNGLSSSPLVQTGQWYQVTVSYINQTLLMYLNSNLILTLNADFNLTDQVDLTIGGRRNGPDMIPMGGFRGVIDDFCWWNRALTEQEIQNLYAGTTPAACPTLSANLQTGLVGYWPFCGNANDESGNGNDGVVNGATLTEDRFGNAASAYGFNGTNSFIQYEADNLPTSTRSVSAWFYSTNIGEGPSGRAILGYGGQSCGQSWNMHLDNAGSPQGPDSYEVNSHCNVFSITSNYGADAPNGAWHHWVAVTSSLGTQFYVDGELVSTDPAFINNTVVAGKDFCIGAYTNTNGVGALITDPNNTPWNGLLDDIGIWNRALTPAEVQELYTGQPVTPPVTCTPLPSNLQTGLVGYWPFCGNANDESGNGNDGVVNGATLTEDRFGNANAAYGFDGLSNFIEVQDDSSIDLSNQYSLSVWVEIPDYTLNNSEYPQRTILSKPRPVGGTGYSMIALTGNEVPGLNTLRYGSGWNDDVANGFIASSDTLPLDSWSHIVFTYDGVVAKLFKNGVESNSGSLNLNLLNSDQPLFFGKEFDFNNALDNRWFKGNLDDIAIYNRALTPAEVQELYTLDACTFTVYDTLTVENIINVYDTLTIENIVDIYDTTYINVEVYDTLTVENIINVYDTLTIENVIDVFDTTTVVETVVVFDTLTVENVIDVFDTTTVVETVVVFDTLTVENVIDVFDTTTVVETVVVFDTLTVENVIDVYDTTYVTVTDTLIIDIPSGVGGTILNTLLLYPNPTSDQLTISYGNFAAMAGYSLSIFDNGGSAVHENESISQAQETLDITQWSAGVYQVVVYNAGGVPVETRQIVIQ
jgi:hypothetical protein